MVILEELYKKTSHNIYKNLNRGEAYFYNLLESIISHKSHELKLLKEEIAILKKLLIQNKGTLDIKNNTNNGHIILGNVFF